MGCCVFIRECGGAMPLVEPWITGKRGAQEIGLETTRKSSEDEEKKQNSIHPHLHTIDKTFSQNRHSQKLQNSQQ